MYNEQDLLEVLQRRPFVPLDLQIATGETFRVSHPDQVLVTSTDGVILTAPSKAKPGTVDWRLVGLDHVVGVTVSQNGSNGN